MKNNSVGSRKFFGEFKKFGKIFTKLQIIQEKIYAISENAGNFFGNFGKFAKFDFIEKTLIYLEKFITKKI